MKNNNVKYFKVFSRKLAYLLRIAGYRVAAVEPNSYKPQFDVYLFEDTDEFRKAFTDIQEKERLNKENSKEA